MKVGVLSDTHVATLAQGHQLAEKLLAGPFSEVVCILHAGDHVHPEIELCFAPRSWYAVRGNMDRLHVCLPEKRIIRLNDWRIGITHGWGGSDDVLDNVINSFSGDMPDVLVFGHSHVPECRRIGSTLLLNPGSPTEPRSASGPTVGILTIDDHVSGEIVSLI